jgi:hypothetical protein
MPNPNHPAGLPNTPRRPPGQRPAKDPQPGRECAYHHKKVVGLQPFSAFPSPAFSTKPAARIYVPPPSSPYNPEPPGGLVYR